MTFIMYFSILLNIFFEKIIKKVTLNHLNGINAILKEGESVKHVNKVKALFVEVKKTLKNKNYLKFSKKIRNFLNFH